MPSTLGLLPMQQESFEHHEELSKLLKETDVFYVPLHNDFHSNANSQDASDVTKRFDEDILNKHLVVTFRNIGYSLFLDAVQSIPDQYDHSKTRVSGKMIVDGICIQFLGCFDCQYKNQDHADVQQINGVGRIQLDEDYYRELSKQILTEETTTEFVDDMKRTERPMPKVKGRSRTISENILGKNHTNILKSPPPSLSNSRSHLPYTLRSPRTMGNASKQQHQSSAPINIDHSSVSRSSGFNSTFISPSSSVASSYNENILDPSQQKSTHIFSQSPQYSSALHNATTMPIQIPSTAPTNITIPPSSLPQFTGIFPVTQSHSLPTYFLPQGNFAYFITNPNQTSPPPLHILTPLNPHSLPFPSAQYSPLLSTQPAAIHESALLVQNKQNQSMETNKQGEEQLPFKKRRYAGQQSSVLSPMDIDQHEDDEASNESMKK
ncbi:unnamed protein product [Adineta ricciae]|uniref:Uncharacterized protein n=1 Tax=Adineta ricciae TaxID=249248 RepID=A0A815HM69_ADIRI|nr:unnamed protein product [Adineta ricciae]